jgi:hypothetical protein
MAVTGTRWLSMVRRRSTVRFRKGAPRSEAFFDTDPVTSPGGFRRKEQVSGSVGSRSLARPRAQDGPGQLPGSVGECRGGALWGQDRYQAALRGVCAPVGVRPWPATLLELQERGDASDYGQRAVTQRAEERAPTRLMLAYLSLAGTLWRRAERAGMPADDADWWRSGLVDGRLPDQRLDGRHPHDAPGRLHRRLRPVSLRPGHLVRRHRNERPTTSPLIATRPVAGGSMKGSVIVTAQAGTMEGLTGSARTVRVAEPGAWRNRRTAAGVQPA